MKRWKKNDEKKMKRKMKKKRKWLLHHALRYSIEFKIEKKEKRNQVQNFWKNGFSLKNYSSVRWLCLRWQTAIFHYPFTIIENYPFAIPFEPNNFSFWTSTKDHPSHWGACVKERQFQRIWRIGSCFNDRKRMPMLKGKCGK